MPCFQPTLQMRRLRMWCMKWTQTKPQVWMALGSFYRLYWPIVKADMFVLVLDFWKTGKMLPKINNTNLVLIPKSNLPNKLNDFRPISLFNFDYNIISKLLANRLKPYCLIWSLPLKQLLSKVDISLRTLLLFRRLFIPWTIRQKKEA